MKESLTIVESKRRKAPKRPKTAHSDELRVETRIRLKKAKKPVKTKIKSISKLMKEADTLFSKKIIARDKHCQYPNCTSASMLTCSHYHGRAKKSTRFDERNCVAICLFHHFMSKDLGYEYQKQTKAKHGYDGQYTIFMKKRFGIKEFNALNKLAERPFKLTRDFLNNLIEELKGTKKNPL